MHEAPQITVEQKFINDFYKIEWLTHSSVKQYTYFFEKVTKIQSNQYIFPEFIFRNHMSHKNEATLRKSISDERK